MASFNKIEGVTLVELLVVVAVISMLAVISVSFLRPQLFKGTDAKRKSDLRRIQVALEEYEKDKDCYPPPALVTCNPGDGLTPYLSKIPCDPKTKSDYFYETDGSSCSLWYRIYSNLENLQDPDIGKVGCDSGCGPGYNFFLGSPNAPNP